MCHRRLRVWRLKICSIQFYYIFFNLYDTIIPFEWWWWSWEGPLSLLFFYTTTTTTPKHRCERNYLLVQCVKSILSDCQAQSDSIGKYRKIYMMTLKITFVTRMKGTTFSGSPKLTEIVVVFYSIRWLFSLQLSQFCWNLFFILFLLLLLLLFTLPLFIQFPPFYTPLLLWLLYKTNSVSIATPTKQIHTRPNFFLSMQATPTFFV